MKKLVSSTITKNVLAYLSKQKDGDNKVNINWKLNIIWFETDFLEGKKENRYSPKYLPQNKEFFEFEGRRKAEMVLENYHQNFMWIIFEFKK